MKQLTQRIALFVIFLFAPPTLISANAQVTSTKNAHVPKVGLTVTPVGENEVIQKSLLGGPGYSGDGFYTIGAACQIPLTSRLDFETGLDYAKHNVIISPADFSSTLYKVNVRVASIPLTVKLNFLKHFFVNGGCLLDIDLSSSSSSNSSLMIDNQDGLGAMLGVGMKYDFKFGGTLFVNPNLKCHSLVHFTTKDYRQRLLEAGIRIGFMYSLSKTP